jgi:hypothetical protein
VRLQRLLPRANSIRHHSAVVDACAYLFRACRELQRTHGDRGLEVLFDVEPTTLPAATCDAIAQVIRAVIDDVSAASESAPAGSSVTLTLHDRGNIHSVMVADRGFRVYRGRYNFAPPSVELLAAYVGADLRVWATADHRIIAIAFGARDARPHLERWRRSTEILAGPVVTRGVL